MVIVTISESSKLVRSRKKYIEDKQEIIDTLKNALRLLECKQIKDEVITICY